MTPVQLRSFFPPPLPQKKKADLYKYGPHDTISALHAENRQLRKQLEEVQTAVEKIQKVFDRNQTQHSDDDSDEIV